MRDTPTWRRYLRFWGPDPLRDVDEELEFHLAMKREEILAAGVPPERVEAEVARAFGDQARIVRELKTIGVQRRKRYLRSHALDEIAIDLRYAWRSFRRRPAVPSVIIGTLALAIGAGTAVFTLFDVVLLNPLAVDRPDELVLIQEETAGSVNTPGLSYPMSRFLRERNTTTSGIAGWTTMDVGVGAADIAARVSAGFVTGNYFSLMGVPPQRGRVLVESDEGEPGTTPYAVVSDALWRRVFGSDPELVGRAIEINEVQVVVVGIARAGFRGTSLAAPVDLWMPLTMVRTVARTGLMANDVVLDTWYFSVFEHVARVPAGTPVSRSLEELSTLHAAGMSNAPERTGRGVTIGEPTVRIVGRPLTNVAAGRSRAELVRFLATLAVVVGITLAIACVNVANLLLMRSRERQLEMTIRTAVGASAGRVARQLVLESLALAVLAGVGGVAVGALTIRSLAAFSLPGGVALANMSMALDARVLGFTGIVVLICAVSFGLAPVIAVARTDAMNALRGGQHGRRAGRIHAGSALIATQVALSLTLLVAGSLFARSLQKALSVDTGFRSEGVSTLSVGLRQYGYSEQQAESFMRDVIDAARVQPGVAHAAAATRVPIETDAFRMPIYKVADMTPLPPPDRATRSAAPRIPVLGITPGYFDALGIELVDGRDIDWSDRSGTRLVAVVTHNAAGRLWPGENPIGRLFVPMVGEPFTVIGIARDAHITGLSEREPHIYVSLLQTLEIAGMDRTRFVAAGPGAAASLNALRNAVQRTDSRLPVFDERNVKQHIDAVLMPQRFGLVLLGTLGGVALVICAIGIYAVAAYDVATRRRELGIRAALGAERRDLVHAVIRRAALAICAGVATGLLIAMFAVQGLRGLLFGITPYEPTAYLAAAVMLGLVAVLASWIPARRAARTDPLTVVRED